MIDPFPPARGRRTEARLAQLAAMEAPEPADALARIARAAAGLDRVARSSSAPAICRRQEQAKLAQAAPAVALADLLLPPSGHQALQDSVVRDAGRPPPRVARSAGIAGGAAAPVLPPRPPPAAFRAVIDALLRARHGASGRPVAAPRDAPGPPVRGRGTALAASPCHARCRALPAAARARSGAGPGGAGTSDAHHAEAFATHRLAGRGCARPFLPAPDRGGNGRTSPPPSPPGTPAGQVTAAAFRDRLDNGRKVAIQVLEFFDRAGLTVRGGDARTVRADRLASFGSPQPEEIP